MRTFISVMALLCLILAPFAAHGAIMAVDLGTEFLKISVVKPGRIPISIVNNEMSKRKTPAAVALVDGDRLVGEEAASLIARFPDKVFTRLRDMLGKTHSDPALQNLFKESHLPYEIVAATNRTTAAVKTDTGETYSAEELVASLLEYAKTLAQVAADGATISDCVIVVPAFFGPAERQALLDAARLAGLNPMALVHAHAAAALQYGIERDFTNKTEDVVFYDLGAGSAQAAWVRFSAYNTSSGVSISQFEVKDVAWAERTGGLELENALVRHFANEHDSDAVLNAPRAVAKLRKQVKRTKEVLSANTEAHISVEDLLPGTDFRSNIGRDAFETLSEKALERALTPVMELMKRNNLTVESIAAFELLGGSSRVPRIKAALSEALGGRSLDMHLDADEAVVLGAGLFAANLSTTFRLRKFGMTDRIPYGVTFTLDGADAGDSKEEDSTNDTTTTTDEDDASVATGTAPPQHILVPAMKKLPTRRGITLTSLTGDSFKASLQWDNKPGAVLPCCHRSGPLGEYEVSGVSAVAAKYNGTDKVALHTRVDVSGVFVVDRADATVQVEEEVVIPVVKKKNVTVATGDDGNSTNTVDANKTTDGENGKEGESASEEEVPPIIELRKRTLKIPLNVTGSLTFPGLSPSEFLASREKLKVLRRRDETKRATAKARNDLESYIISMKGKLEDSESLKAVSTEKERTKLSSELTDTEEWLYGDEGEAADAAILKEKLSTLRSQGDAIERRAAEKERRPGAISGVADFVAAVKKALATWPKEKPWIDPHETEGVTAKLNELTAWLDKKVAAQKKLKDHEEPAFTVSEVMQKVDAAKKAYERLSAKKKPPPPPPSPDEKAAAGNETEKEASGGSGETGAADGGAKEDGETHDEL